MLSNIAINEDILTDPKYDYLFSVELVNQFVLEGLPFRDAYKKVGLMIESGEYKPLKTVNHTSLGSIGNLATEQIKEQFEGTLKGFGFAEIQQRLSELLYQEENA